MACQGELVCAKLLKTRRRTASTQPLAAQKVDMVPVKHSKENLPHVLHAHLDSRDVDWDAVACRHSQNRSWGCQANTPERAAKFRVFVPACQW